MYRVVWLKTALEELAAAWMHADSSLRQAITAASHQLDQLLQSDPLNQGESRLNNRRIMFEPPLGVTYEVRQQAGIVRVLHVWVIRQRG